MTKYTVKDLKKDLIDIDDSTEVCVERIEDIYFEKYGWETLVYDFNKQNPGLETVEYLSSFCSIHLKKDKKFIISSHY